MTTILYASNAAYDKLVAETVDQLVQLGISKGGEYASGSNRLENFVHNAIELGLEPEHVWAVYAAKHWDALRTYVTDIAKGYDRVRSEPIEGRADDLMVYLMLFKALVAARRNGGRFELEVSPAPTPVARGEKNSGDVLDIPAPIPAFLTTTMEKALKPEQESTEEADLAQAVSNLRKPKN